MRALRRWAGRTGSATNADCVGSGVGGATQPVFGKEGGETYLRWSQPAGVSGFLQDQLTNTPYLQISFDVRQTQVVPANILVYQARSAAGAAQGNIVQARNNATTASWLLRGPSDGIVGAQTIVSVGEWIRLQMAFQASTTTTAADGKIKGRLTRISTGAVLTQGELLDRVTQSTGYLRSHLGKLGTGNAVYMDIKNLIVGNDGYEFLDPAEYITMSGGKRNVPQKYITQGGAKKIPTGYYRTSGGVLVPIT